MPQLNFTIPESLLAKIDAAVPEYLDRKGFLCLLIDQALTQGCTIPAYRVGAGTGSHRTAVEAVMGFEAVEASRPQHPLAETSTPTTPSVAVVPKAKKFEPVVTRGGLQKFEAEILAFWKVKKGAKNEQAWSMLLTELEKIQAKHGDAVVLEQLQLGVQSGTWSSISLARYEQFKPKPGRPNEVAEVPKHPASRLFQNGRFVDEDGPTTNPALQGLF